MNIPPFQQAEAKRLALVKTPLSRALTALTCDTGYAFTRIHSHRGRKRARLTAIPALTVSSRSIKR